MICSSLHSGQGCICLGIIQEIIFWLNTSGDTARLFAQNFDARLAGIVIWPECPLFRFFYQGSLKSMKIDWVNNIRVQKSQGVFSRNKSACGKHIDHGVVGWHSKYKSIYVHICPYMSIWSMRGYLWTWYFINLGIAWIFFNVDIYYSCDLSNRFGVTQKVPADAT